MSAVSRALAGRRLAGESAAWSLLRASNGPVAIAILSTHLAGDTRRLAAPVFLEAVENDLEDLRAHGFELPQMAAGYVRDWLAAGYLVRRPGDDHQEWFEASEGALAAVRFFEQLAEPRTSVTESRLATIVERVHRLAVETDPDLDRRIGALTAERDQLDKQIQALLNGEQGAETLSADRAREQALDVLALAAELPEDFARVRAALEQLNRELRAQLIEEPASRGAVLDDIFRGVDLLASSDAGRSFTGFYALILNPERSTALEEELGEVLSGAFATGLTPAQRWALATLLPGMQQASAEIHQVMTAFSRSLRRFVQSDELAEGRAVFRLIREAITQARAVAQQVSPIQKMPADLQLTGTSISSISALALHNPADSETTRPVEIAATTEADLELLRLLVRESEIDMAELTDAVNQTLAARGAATIAEVLADHPATQGVASVIGLIVLAVDHATPAGASEVARWGVIKNDDDAKNDDGALAVSQGEDAGKGAAAPSSYREALIPTYLFETPIA